MKQEKVIIYRLDSTNNFYEIVPLKFNRQWMDNTQEKFAYKCLPLGISNSYGWTVLSPADFSISWDGGRIPESIKVHSNDQFFLQRLIHSLFGEGVITLQLDFIVRTPENYSLYIRGVPNDISENIIIRPLDAIVETDWLPFTFTYNFKFIKPGTVYFKKGQPLFSFFPIERNTVEKFLLEEQKIENNQDLLEDFKILGEERFKQNQEQLKFSRFYFNAKSAHKAFKVKNHIKKLFFSNVSKPDTIE